MENIDEIQESESQIENDDVIMEDVAEKVNEDITEKVNEDVAENENEDVAENENEEVSKDENEDVAEIENEDEYQEGIDLEYGDQDDYYGSDGEEEDPSDAPNADQEMEENKDMQNDEKEEKDERLKEVDVGIEKFVSDHKGFFGIIKQRFSDFVVNEINLEGKVIELTDTTVPSNPYDINQLLDDHSKPPSVITPDLLMDLTILSEQTRCGKKGRRNTTAVVPDKLDEDKVVEKDDNQVIMKDENKVVVKDENEVEDKVVEKVSDGQNEVEDKVVEKISDGQNEVEDKVVEKVSDGQNEVEDKVVEKVSDGQNEVEGGGEKSNEGNNAEESVEQTPNDDDDSSKKSGPDLDLTEKDAITKSTEGKKYVKEVLINVTGLDKTERATVHQFIKSRFNNISANTVDKNDQKCIVVKAGLDRRTAKSYWSKDKSFTTFVLYKENVDTMEAINIISWRLHVKTDYLGYAGTKDRRGKTSQQVSVYQVSPQSLVNSVRNCREIRVGNFQFLKDKLALGRLQGNRFRIVIREVKGEDDDIMTAIDSLKEKGFINYYGMQRFGNTSVPTYSIGAVLLKQGWQEAVDLILKQRDSDTPEMVRAREIWHKTRNAKKAYLELTPKKLFTIEAMLLKGLMRTGGNDYLSALFKIPNKTRMLYLHSYQSFIWNRIVSRRIEKYGHKVLPGDLIRKNPKNNGKIVEEETESERVTENKVSLETDFIEEFTDQIFPVKEFYDDELVKVEETPDVITNESEVHILTAEEAENENISNVVLPLPGFYITYPDNEIKGWYLELLEKDSLNFEMLKTKHKGFSLGGSYRNIFVQPTDVEGSICYYDDGTKALIPSDLDKIQNIPIKENRLTEGKYKAVLLEFKLPASSYATMALRELLKMDTSPQYQSTLNSSDLDNKSMLPWQQVDVNSRDRLKTSPRGQRGQSRGRVFSPRGGRRGWSIERGRPMGGFRGRGWGSPRGRGHERGQRWMGMSRGRGSWMPERGRGWSGSPRGRGGPPLPPPNPSGPPMHWAGPKGPGYGDWNQRNSGPPFNESWVPNNAGPSFYDEPPWYGNSGGEWNRGGSGSWNRGHERGRRRGNVRAFGAIRGNKRSLNDNSRGSNKRGRF